jgi:hypothetical protein
MKIELKKIKLNLEFSEETLMYRADIYIDGYHAGYCENDGHGGCTSYHWLDQKGKDLIIKAQNYVELMPEKNYGDFKYKLRLHDYLDDLVNEHLRKKEEKQWTKKIDKMCQNGIVLGNDIEYVHIKFNYSLADLCKHRPLDIKKKIEDALDKYKDRNYRRLNTNIPYDILTT